MVATSVAVAIPSTTAVRMITGSSRPGSAASSAAPACRHEAFAASATLPPASGTAP